MNEMKSKKEGNASSADLIRLDSGFCSVSLCSSPLRCSDGMVRRRERICGAEREHGGERGLPVEKPTFRPRHPAIFSWMRECGGWVSSVYDLVK